MDKIYSYINNNPINSQNSSISNLRKASQYLKKEFIENNAIENFNNKQNNHDKIPMTPRKIIRTNETLLIFKNSQNKKLAILLIKMM